MFIVLLKFSSNKDQADRFMEEHASWLSRGLADNVFLLAGSLPSSLGGAILAHNVSRSELSRRVNEDPFVRENVVAPEIIELAPSRADERLAFLLG